MEGKLRPAQSTAVRPVSGAARDGQPLSWNRAPAADLAPWIARVFLTAAETPPDHVLRCGLLCDTAFVRVLTKGQWSGETADGPVRYADAPLFFGSNSRRMPIAVRGSFAVCGFALRPGASRLLGDLAMPEPLDAIRPIPAKDGVGAALCAAAATPGDPETVAQQIEAVIRTRIARQGAVEPHWLTAAFDAAALADPTITVRGFADSRDVEARRLARQVRRDFGLTPKQVLRRARVLDMASHLRGVADAGEAPILAERFYDQSHMIRDFHHYFGMSPQAFVATPQPILTLSLEVRQARRLESMERLGAGQPRPWQ